MTTRLELSDYDLATIGSALMDESRKELAEGAPALAWNSAGLAARIYRAMGDSPACVELSERQTAKAYDAMMAKRRAAGLPMEA